MSNRLILTWKELKQCGWPYCRTHTWRLMRAGKFPMCMKLFDDRNSHPVWSYQEVLDFFEKRGLEMKQRGWAIVPVVDEDEEVAPR